MGCVFSFSCARLWGGLNGTTKTLQPCWRRNFATNPRDATPLAIPSIVASIPIRVLEGKAPRGSLVARKHVRCLVHLS